MASNERHTHDGKVRRVISNPESFPEDQESGSEEVEIAAQINVPAEDCWSWVILACSFISISLIDGISFTFGAVIDDMSRDLNKPMSLVGLISSIQMSLYFLVSPIAAALINKLGFRACMMAASMEVSLCLLITYFTKHYEFICFFYGACVGFGACIINMSGTLSVGFYFEKYRNVALAIAGTGTSFGVMSFFPLNAYLTKCSGWRSTTLFQSGLSGIIYFLGLSYQPLLSFTVTIEEEDVKEPTRTVTTLPSLSKASATVQGGLQSTLTERALRAVSNAHFPTAAAVVRTPAVVNAGSGTAPVQGTSRLALKANTQSGAISSQQLKQVQSIISKQNVQSKLRCNVDLTCIKVEPPMKRGFFAKLFDWKPNIEQARPLYRDDAFYQGRLQDLPEYQKSVLNTDASSRTGLEYQLAVTRAVTVNDLQEKRGVFTTAVRRVLASMLDPTLLKKHSFLLLCLNGLLCNLGYLIPFVYLKDKNEKAGIDPLHCSFIVSSIGLMNGIARIVLGFLTAKVDPLKMFIACVLVNGASTLCCPIMHGVYLQYLYAVTFGFTGGGLFGLRSIVVCKIYGLEKLTNGVGIILMFLGIANLVSVPVGGILEDKYGYEVVFYYAGICIFLSGVLVIPLQKIITWEKKKEQANRLSSNVKETGDQSFTAKTPPPSPPTPPPPPPTPRSPTPPSSTPPSPTPPSPPPTKPTITSPQASTSFPSSSRHYQQQRR